MVVEREIDDAGSEPPVDARELGALLEGFRPRLRRLVDLRLDPRLRRRVDASDVLQETFVEVTRRLHEYPREKMPFFVWVRLLTAQKVNELQRRHIGAQKRDVRREQVARPAQDDSTVYLARAIADREESPSQCLSRREREERLRQTLARMRSMDSEVLLLRHFEQLSNVDTAGVLGLTPRAAAARHLRAVKRLRELLRGHEDLFGGVFTPDGEGRSS